jgi:hypothetical protein
MISKREAKPADVRSDLSIGDVATPSPVGNRDTPHTTALGLEPNCDPVGKIHCWHATNNMELEVCCRCGRVRLILEGNSYPHGGSVFLILRKER